MIVLLCVRVSCKSVVNCWVVLGNVMITQVVKKFIAVTDSEHLL